MVIGKGPYQGKEVRRGHGRADHVLLRREELHGAVPQLGALHHVPPLAVRIEGAEVINRHFVRELAHVTPEPPAAVDELHERVDVGPAPAAPHDSGGAELRDGDVFARNQGADDTPDG